jgi:hypothetical protein
MGVLGNVRFFVVLCEETKSASAFVSARISWASFEYAERYGEAQHPHIYKAISAHRE